jgi:hypothetical protein
VQSVVDELGLQIADLFPARSATPGRETVFQVRDGAGAVVAHHVRRDHPDGGKSYAWRTPDGRTGLQGMPASDLPLYGVELVSHLAASVAPIVTEGEKAAEALMAIGWPAVGTVTGASGTPSLDSLRPLARFTVVLLWPDNDTHGREHMNRIGARLGDLGVDVRVIDWQEAPPKGDAADFVRQGGSNTALAALVQAAPPIAVRVVDDGAGNRSDSARATGSAVLRLVPVDSVLDEPDEALEWVVEGLLLCGAFSVVGAKPKVGKSTFLRALCAAIAQGEQFLGRQVLSGPVIYVSIEEHRAQVRKHFKRLIMRPGAPLHIHFGATPPDGIKQLGDAIESISPALVVIDPLFKMVRVRDESSYAEVTRALEPILALARDHGCHVAVSHHNSKVTRGGGDDLLGSTAIFGGVDTAVLLRRKADARTRTIETVQRYGEDLEPTVIALDETGGVYLAGDLAAYERERLQARILDELRKSPGKEITDEEMVTLVGTRKIEVLKNLRALYEAGSIYRRGEGKKGDPFRYFVAPGGRA